MIDDVTLKKLAHLSRISLTPEEEVSFRHDMEDILTYVERIQEVSETAPEDAALLQNVMRDDGEPHESGVYSERLIAEAPSSENGYIAVRKVIDQG